jgi:hypothetical protein
LARPFWNDIGDPRVRPLEFGRLIFIWPRDAGHIHEANGGVTVSMAFIGSQLRTHLPSGFQRSRHVACPRVRHMADRITTRGVMPVCAAVSAIARVASRQPKFL